MAQEVGSRSLRSLDPTSCLPQTRPSRCFVWCYGPEFTSRRHDRLGRRLEGRAGAHPARPADAERTRRKLPWQAARRVPQRNLVPDAERCQVYSGNLARGVQLRAAHSPLDYRTPQEFRQQFGYADMESKERFPHPHSRGGDGDENKISKQNQNRETPVING
jgi:hypothetical protein